MRTILIAGCCFWLSSGAFADCESDARTAFARLSTSGPYHFDKLKWDRGKTRHLIGKAIPGYRMYYRLDGEDHEEFYERKEPNSSSATNLEKDIFGWKGPFNTNWDDDDEDPDNLKILQFRCLGSESKNGRVLLIFERTWRFYSTDLDPDKAADRLFVDSQSGLPVRRERNGEKSLSYRNVVTTYTFDPAITIDRPRINLKARWDASIKAYEASVQAAEPSCRAEVLDILDRGSSTLPFEYRITPPEMSWVVNGITGVIGVFVPPNSTYQKWEGYPGHGAGNEFVSIANEFWLKSPSFGVWKRQRAALPAAGQVSADWNAPISLYRDEYFRKHPRRFFNHVGYVSCLPAATRENRRYLVYQYDVFRDTRRERKPLARRTMFVDPETRLPLEFEESWPKGAMHEWRRYDASLKVDAPKLGE